MTRSLPAALGDGGDKPDKLALEPWLYRLAIHAIGDLLARSSDNVVSVHLEESARIPNVRASDEPELQFHQPDETLTKESVIADRRVATPEDIASSDEMNTLVEFALSAAAPATAKFLSCTPWKDSRWRKSPPLPIANRRPSTPRSSPPANTCGVRRLLRNGSKAARFRIPAPIEFLRYRLLLQSSLRYSFLRHKEKE